MFIASSCNLVHTYFSSMIVEMKISIFEKNACMAPCIENICMHPFAMETAAILVHSLNRLSLCTKMAAVAVAKLLHHMQMLYIYIHCSREVLYIYIHCSREVSGLCSNQLASYLRYA